MVFSVELSKLAQKQYMKLPIHIQKSLRTWTDIIENEGILSMRKIPGFHDEPLKGNRQGQRSSRLSRGYRVIYEIDEQNTITIVVVLEVNKHDY